MDLSPYVTEGNSDCRAVRVGDVCVLALTKKPHAVTRHKALCNAFGTAVKAKCPLTACKRGFVDGVTMIAPVIILGPISHGNLGGNIWVCKEHWAISVEGDEDGDDELSKVALKFEANVFEKRGNLKVRRGKSSNGGKAKKVLFPGIKASGSGVANRLSLRKKAKESAADMFNETAEIVDESEDDFER